MRVVHVDVTDDECAQISGAQSDPLSFESDNRTDFSRARRPIPNAQQDGAEIGVNYVPASLMGVVNRVLQHSYARSYFRQRKQRDATLLPAISPIEPRDERITTQSKFCHSALQMCFVERHQVRLWRIEVQMSLKFSFMANVASHIHVVQYQIVKRLRRARGCTRLGLDRAATLG